jgi:hypothetical protein
MPKDCRLIFILAVCACTLMPTTIAFAPPKHNSRTLTTLFAQENENLLDRFTNPVIEDPWLPLNEAGIAQVVAPSLQLFWLASVNSPFPSWATPFLSDLSFAPRGSFLAPTLVHGAGLACCWLLGALASKGYEQNDYEGSLGTVFLSTVKAGAFACGLLILATQFDLYTEMGGYVQVGDSVETDIIIYKATVEVINDCVFEAITLLTWRLYRSAAATL